MVSTYGPGSSTELVALAPLVSEGMACCDCVSRARFQPLVTANRVYLLSGHECRLRHAGVVGCKVLLAGAVKSLFAATLHIGAGTEAWSLPIPA